MKTIDKPKEVVTDATVAPESTNTVEFSELLLTRPELDFLLRAVSTDEHRPALQCVCVTHWTNGMVSVCTTDTHRLHTVVLRPKSMTGGGLHPKSRYLLSAERLKAYVRMHKPVSILLMHTQDVLTEVLFKGAKAPQALEPASTFAESFVRPENYPNVQRVVPVDTGVAVGQFAMNGKYLHDAMLSECNRVVVSGLSPSKPFIITDRAHDGNPWALRSFAVIMPMAIATSCDRAVQS